MEVGGGRLVLEQDPSTWKAGDEIVVTTTDYLPGHSEKLQILYNYTGGTTIDFEAVDSPTKKIQWPHNGVRYGGPNDTAHKKLTDRLPDRLKNSLDSDHVVKSGAETRAAVALLAQHPHRICRPGSGGRFPSGSYRLFVRRPHGHPAGLQGGSDSGRRIRADGPGRTARSLPHPLPHGAANTRQYLGEGLVDQRIDDALDRAALDARRDRAAQCRLQVDRPRLLSRGAGPKPTTSSIPISGSSPAPPSTTTQNPRKFRASLLRQTTMPTDVSRVIHFVTRLATFPSVFWITNGWNDFIGNMAAGAGACGAAYWFVPALNSDRPDVPTANNVQDGTHMKWSGYGYAALQNNLRGTTPLKSFYKNYATSTMMSIRPPATLQLATAWSRRAIRARRKSSKPSRASLRIRTH